IEHAEPLPVAESIDGREIAVRQSVRRDEVRRKRESLQREVETLLPRLGQWRRKTRHLRAQVAQQTVAVRHGWRRGTRRQFLQEDQVRRMQARATRLPRRPHGIRREYCRAVFAEFTQPYAWQEGGMQSDPVQLV